MKSSRKGINRLLIVLALFIATGIAIPSAMETSATKGIKPLSPAAYQSLDEKTSQRSSPANSKGDTEPDTSDLGVIPIDLPGLGRGGKLVTPNGFAGTTEGSEVEPNGTSATATPLGSTDIKIKGNIFPVGDVDFYSFTAAMGDRVYAATMTSFSASGNFDSVLDLIASDGTTVLETDNDDGSFGTTASTIAGFTIPSAGTFYLRVRHNLAAMTSQLRPYDLYVRVQSGSPTPETEPNNTFPGQALPASGWVSGSTSSTTDVDFYAINLTAGDTVFVSLDLDPERDTVEWNGQLGLGAFGTPPLILVVNDGGLATPDSEAFFMTVQATGTYGIFVGLPTGGTTFGTYHLSVSVLPHVNRGINCTTYTSTNVPVTIPTGPAIVSSTLTVPGNPTIESIRVKINLTHNFMADLDVQLTSPTGNTIGLFSDVGSVTVGSQTTMDTTIDDYAGIPIGQFTVVQGPIFQPELNYRLDWFKGQPAGGTWTLTIRDDATGDGGTLNNWSLEICEPAAAPSCGMGTSLTTVFNTDFEAGAAGFTHSGVQDEWELGLPTAVPVTGCNSGTNCWKTDLDNTYNASSNQDLLSPNINLAGLSGPVILTWAQKFQMESATFDHAFVEVREVGVPANSLKVWEWLGATMTDAVGNPTVTIQEAGGWGIYRADISAFAGLNVELRFHLDSDTTVQLGGLAIDDVKVTACMVASCMLTCPANVIQSNDPNQCGAVVTYPAPTTTGSCGTVTCSPASGSFFPVGTTTVTCSSNSGAGPEMCTFTVLINDTQPPSITCPANITASNDPNQCGAVVNYPPPTVSDNCPGVGTPACSPASGSFFPKGTTTVSCNVADASSNTSTCTFTVTVNDTQSPSITCPANITTSNDPNQCGAVVTYPPPTASDNCPGVGTPVCSPASGSFFPKGTTTVTCTVADASSNTSSCTSTVTVNDTQPPAITCPPSRTVVSPNPMAPCVNVTFSAPTVTDNCPKPTAVCSPPSGSCFPIGTTTVTCTATDASGNTATCSFIVTTFNFCVQDDSDPTKMVLVNTATGEYQFCCGGNLYAGTGSVTVKGGLVTVQHNTGTRRVLIKVDLAVKQGTASFASPPGVMLCQIRDTNISNNSCVCALQ